jgi:hypothetical protein
MPIETDKPLALRTDALLDSPAAWSPGTMVLLASFTTWSKECHPC